MTISANLLTACKRDSAGETGNTKTRVSIILPHSDDGYWNEVAQGIQSRKEMADDADVDIKILYPTLNYSADQMTDLINQQIDAQVDAIVVQGNSQQEYVDALNDAASHDIQIVCVDTDLENEIPDHLYVGTNNYEAGKMLGENLIRITGGHGTVGIISGMAGYPNLEERLQGLMDTVKDCPGITVLDTLYDNYDAMTFMDRYFAFDSADVLVCLEGTGAQTLSKNAQRPDSRYRYIVGFDIAQGIANGVIDGVILQNQYSMGQCVVDQLISYKKNGRYDSDKIYTDISWVDADNYGNTEKNQ